MSEETTAAAAATRQAEAAAEPVKRVLVLGCGSHELYGALRHDFSRAGSGDTVNLAHDLNDVPWPWGEGDFDDVSGAGIVEQLRLEPADLLAECARVLAPKGRLYLLSADGRLLARLAKAAEKGPWRQVGDTAGGALELVRT